MSSQVHSSDIEYKADVTTHDEAIADSKVIEGHAVSAYITLGRLATARKFWKACLFCACAAFGKFLSCMCLIVSAAIFDGFAVTIPGSIVANQGFIQIFGTERGPTGAQIIPANQVGAWTGVQSAGQIIGMFSIPFISDRFGRKIGLYGVLVALLLVCGAHCFR